MMPRRSALRPADGCGFGTAMAAFGFGAVLFMLIAIAMRI